MCKIFSSIYSRWMEEQTEVLSEYFKITETANSGSRTSLGVLKQYFIETIKFTNSPDKINDFSRTLENSENSWCRIPWPRFHNGKMLLRGLPFGRQMLLKASGAITKQEHQNFHQIHPHTRKAIFFLYKINHCTQEYFMRQNHNITKKENI